jgi:hypothetical protein
MPGGPKPNPLWGRNRSDTSTRSNLLLLGVAGLVILVLIVWALAT